MTALSGITWDHPRGYAPLEACAAVYAQETGDTIAWQRRSLQAFADRPLSLLARDHDLLVIDHPHLGEAIADGALVPLDALLPAAMLNALAAATIGPSFASYRLADRQWALPIDAAAQVAAFRPDLLPHSPASWREVLALADEQRVLMPLKPVDAIDSFMTISAHLGSPLRMDAAWIDDAIAHRALSLLRRLADRLPVACFDQDPIATLDMLSEGGDRAYAPLLFGYTNYARASVRSHPIRFADMPTIDGRPPRGSILGGAGIAVSAHSVHREAAVDAAAWLASAAVQAGPYVAHGGQPAHAAAWEDADADRRVGGFFGATRATMDGAWLRPRDDGFLGFVDIAGDLVNDCLRGRRDVEPTLAALADAHVHAVQNRGALRRRRA